MDAGYIAIYRKLKDWEWYKNSVVKDVFIDCLLSANHKDGKWQGHCIKRGQFISSVGNIANSTGFSIQNVRTAIKSLKSTNELTSKSTNKYTVFTVLNYDLYQGANKQTNKQLTNKQQTTNKQLTTNNNDNNEKNVNNDKNIYAENVKMTQDEYDKLVEQYGLAKTDDWIDRVNLYKGSTGKKYKSDYMTILSWIRKDEKKPVKAEVSFLD